MPSIEEAIAAAKAAAGSVASTGLAALPEQPASVAGAVTNYNPTPAATPVSLDEIMATGGMSVKAFMKVDKMGFLIGQDTTTLFDEIAVGVRLSDVLPFFGLRYEIGGSYKYEKSYNRVSDARSGQSWAKQIEDARRIDQKCKGDYPAVDVPMIVLETLKANKKGGEKVLIEAGEKLGLSTSITNFALFREFATAMGRNGYPRDAMLLGKVKHESKTANGNTWGLVHWVDFAPGDIDLILGAPEGE